jgi:hypothetical protein
MGNAEPTRLRFGEGRSHPDRTSETSRWSAGVVATACMKEEIWRNTGSPTGKGYRNREPARDRLGPIGVTDRLAVPRKPGNSGGGKGPEFKVKVQSARIGD